MTEKNPQNTLQIYLVHKKSNACHGFPEQELGVSALSHSEPSQDNLSQCRPGQSSQIRESLFIQS